MKTRKKAILKILVMKKQMMIQRKKKNNKLIWKKNLKKMINKLKVNLVI